MEEVVTIPILDDLNQQKLKDVLQKSASCNAIIIRNQGIFVWADDWQSGSDDGKCVKEVVVN